MLIVDLEIAHIDLSLLMGCAAEARYPSDMLEATNANVSETVEQAQAIGHLYLHLKYLQ